MLKGSACREELGKSELGIFLAVAFHRYQKRRGLLTQSSGTTGTMGEVGFCIWKVK